MKNHIIALAAIYLIGCSEKQPQTQTQQHDAGGVAPQQLTFIPAPAPVAPMVRTIEAIVAAKSHKEAWALCDPYFKNVQPGETENRGKELYSVWADDNLKWKDVNVSADETSPGLVFKNPSRERGKRICATGTIIQIHEIEDSNASEGLLQSYSGALYNFRNFGSSGTLTARKQARLCGYVAGIYSYRNSGGGTGHAIDVAGVWSIPENK